MTIDPKLSWWWKKAVQLQELGIYSEGDKDDFYSRDDVRRAIIYTRQDTVMVVSLLSSINHQLQLLRRIGVVLALLVGSLALLRAFG